MPYDPIYFTNNFNTALNQQQEQAFQNWAAENNRLGDLEDYDLRGFWLNNNSFAPNGHGSDQFKKPNHPTFSDQSMYNGLQNPQGGNFVGGTWDESKNGQVSFTPSAEMLRGVQPLDFLRNYMQRVEPGVVLNMDRRQALANALKGK